jgi:phosphate-selective porin OprO/OprP
VRTVLLLASLIALAPLTAQAQPDTAASAGEKGFGLKSADGSFEFRLRGLLQMDSRHFIDDPAAARASDTFLLRRMEPAFEFTLGRLAYLKLQPQFAGDSVGTSDVFADLRFSKAVVLRAGKFKEPLVLEYLQSSGALTFMERGFPTELGAGRDFGVQLHGELLSGTVAYALGRFNGAPDGRDAVSSDTDDRKEHAARLFFEPFRNGDGALRGLGFGVAGSSGTKLGAATTATFNNTLPRYRSPGQATVFSYRSNSTPTLANTAIAAGDHTRLTPQLYFYAGSFGVLAEQVRSEQEVSFNGAAQTLAHNAWQAVAIWVVTGEKTGYRGVAGPASPYVPEGEGWGAFEIGIRYGELDVDDAAFPVYADPDVSVSAARSAGLVANWYLTGNVRLVLDYTSTGFSGGAAAGADRDREQALFTRLQWSF